MLVRSGLRLPIHACTPLRFICCCLRHIFLLLWHSSLFATLLCREMFVGGKSGNCGEQWGMISMRQVIVVAIRLCRHRCRVQRPCRRRSDKRAGELGECCAMEWSSACRRRAASREDDARGAGWRSHATGRADSAIVLVRLQEPNSTQSWHATHRDRRENKIHRKLPSKGPEHVAVDLHIVL